MITGLRSAILCETVQETLKGASLINLYTEQLLAVQRPGLIEGYLSVMVDTDGRATRGAITLEAHSFSQSFAFGAQEGDFMPTIAVPVMLPVIKAGPLTLTVRDGDAPNNSFTARWRLDFAPRAKLIRPDQVATLIATCNAHAKIVRENLMQRETDLKPDILN